MISALRHYQYINYGKIPHACFAAIPNMMDRTLLVWQLVLDIHDHFYCYGVDESQPCFHVFFQINGFSKGYAMTGWRLGYVAGPEHVIPLINKVHGQTTGCCSSISQMAAITALSMDDTFIKEMCEEYRYVWERRVCHLLRYKVNVIVLYEAVLDICFLANLYIYINAYVMGLPI